MQSKATTVAAYLAELPDDRRTAIEAVRKLILKNLDRGYEERMQYGMIGYCVPHSIYPAGYHTDPKQALPYVCLASQKNHMSLYMMPLYEDGENLARFEAAFKQAGKKLDMGKSCVRFKKVDDLALEAIAEVIRATPVKKYIAWYEAAMLQNAARKASRPTKKASPKKTPVKKAASKKRR